MFIDAPDTIYTVFQRNGVICLSISALLSLLAILALLIFKRPKQREFQNGHIFGYFISLLVANAILAISTLLNFTWVGYNAVMEGSLCNWQGGIKNFGNVTAALWSLMIAIQLFNLLFVRWKSTKWGFWASMILGWGGCLFLAIIGPAFIQKPDWPSYFGPSGAWCWITPTYRNGQIFLEYFLEYLSIGISFVLYIFIILRVRGNLIRAETKWQFRKVPSEEAWQPSSSRDTVDAAMIKVARTMVWFPIAYMVLLIPVSITRFCEWAGSPVPFEMTILTDILFNLMGVVDVLLILYVEHLFPSIGELPLYAETDSTFDPNLMIKYKSVAQPFTLGRTTSGRHRRERAIYIPFPERVHFPSFTRRTSQDSNASDESFGHDPKDIV